VPRSSKRCWTAAFKRISPEVAIDERSVESSCPRP
jgi:hypothetical protein